jgi:hypothetical protein
VTKNNKKTDALSDDAARPVGCSTVKESDLSKRDVPTGKLLYSAVLTLAQYEGDDDPIFKVKFRCSPEAEYVDIDGDGPLPTAWETMCYLVDCLENLENVGAEWNAALNGLSTPDTLQ